MSNATEALQIITALSPYIINIAKKIKVILP